MNTSAANEMDVTYFWGMDSLILGVSEKEIVETRDVGEGCQIGLDTDGKIVSISDEHAGEHIDVLRFSYERIPA